MKIEFISHRETGFVLLVPLDSQSVGFGNRSGQDGLPIVFFGFTGEQLRILKIFLGECVRHGEQPALSLNKNGQVFDFLLTLAFVDDGTLQFLRPFAKSFNFGRIFSQTKGSEIKIIVSLEMDIPDEGKAAEFGPANFLAGFLRHRSFILKLGNAEDDKDSWSKELTRLLPQEAGAIEFHSWTPKVVG